MIRKLPVVEERVETGAIQFGDDWPGLFIRGDSAMLLASAIERIIPVFANLKPEEQTLTTIFALNTLGWFKQTIEEEVIIHGDKETKTEESPAKND